MAALGDGSVRFIRYTIDAPTFLALGNRQDGAVLKDY
jgi:hypothetical protein